jgi:SAM-dependent methyltransferase
MDAVLYDELARMEATHWWFRARRKIVWSLVDRYSEREAGRRLKVCELGCGTGGNLVGKSEQHEIVGVECSDLALQHARRVLGDRVRYGRLPDDVNLPRATYDVVLLTDVLEHIEDDAASARTALDLLRPGGIVVATVPAYQWLFSPRDARHHHFRRYGKRQFASLWDDAQADKLLLSHYNTLLFPLAAAVRLTSKVLGGQGSGSDLSTPLPVLNAVLESAMASERNLLGRLTLPFGLSLVAVVRKRLTAKSAVIYRAA